MDSSPNRRWQFSLRTLMLCMLACAALFGVWKALGTNVFLWLSFAALFAVPVVILANASKAAYLISFFAVYGPFVVMASYTYFYVACPHCKATTWGVLPYGPGIVPVELGRRLLDLSMLNDSLSSALSFIVSVVMVVGLTWVLRTRGLWWQVFGVAAVLAVCSLGAFVVLALIQA